MRFAKFVKVRPERFGAVVFDTLKEKIFVSNEVGGEILRLLDEGRSFEDLVGELSQRYVAPVAQIEADVSSFVEELKKNNLVDVDGDANPK